MSTCVKPHDHALGAGVVSYDRSRVAERRVLLPQLIPRSPMGKILTVVGLVIIGVVAGFLVRLVVPNHLLRRRG